MGAILSNHLGLKEVRVRRTEFKVIFRVMMKFLGLIFHYKRQVFEDLVVKNFSIGFRAISAFIIPMIISPYQKRLYANFKSLSVKTQKLL